MSKVIKIGLVFLLEIFFLIPLKASMDISESHDYATLAAPVETIPPLVTLLDQSRAKTHSCDHPGCGRKFTRFSDLKTHKKLHTGERPCSCDYPGCGKSFAHLGYLGAHKKIHAEERPCSCDYPGCGKSFTRSSNLKTHKKLHTGERPYSCDYPKCGKSFSQSAHLKDHIKTHTGERPYSCDYPECGKSFRQLTHLRTHKKTQHPSVQPSAQLHHLIGLLEEGLEDLEQATLEYEIAQAQEEESVMESQIVPPSQLFMCVECLEQFPTLSTWENHLESHL